MCQNNCCGNMNNPYNTNGGCNVVNKCFVEEVPHNVCCHTHVVNNVVRRHVFIPNYSESCETVYYDEFPQMGNMYNQGINRMNLF